MEPLKVFNVVCDIDNFYTDTKVKAAKEIKFFQQHGFVLTAIKTHYIFPGVVELIQLLFQQPDIKVSFYSSGEQRRIELFVERLLIHALGNERYLEVKDKLLVFSGKKENQSTDLVHNTDTESDTQWQKYRLSHGNKKKCLEKVLGPGETIENSVLIDDDPTWVKCGQERNYLYVPRIETSDYAKEKIYSKHYNYTYNENGYMRILFQNCTSWRYKEILADYIKDRITNAKFIGLLDNIKNCTLCYFNSVQKKYEELELLQKTDDSLLKAIKVHYGEKTSEASKIPCDVMTKEELDQALYTLIEARQGKTTTINLTMNRICYVAGVLFKAIEHARTGSTLAEFLFPLHFLPKKRSGAYKPLFDTEKASHNNEEYYHYGLEKLRQVNPHFTFITPQIYRECCAKKISEEEEKILKTLYENQIHFW